MGQPALPADQRPVDPTPVHTVDLPPTPIRDRNIPASAWIEAPAVLLRSGDDIRRDATGGDVQAAHRPLAALAGRAGQAAPTARYVAIDSPTTLDRTSRVPAVPRRHGRRTGPSGAATPDSGRGRKISGIHLTPPGWADAGDFDRRSPSILTIAYFHYPHRGNTTGAA